MGLFSKNKSAVESASVGASLDPPLPDARVDPEPYHGSEEHLEQLEEARANNGQRLTVERPGQQSLFLMTLRKTGNISKACAAAEISRTTAYQWKAHDDVLAADGQGGDGFSARWDEVHNAYIDDLETETDRRAFSGVDVPVIYQGELQYDVDPESGERTLVTIKRYSDSLVGLRLKALRPDKYRERNETHHTGGTANTTRVTFLMPDNGRD